MAFKRGFVNFYYEVVDAENLFSKEEQVLKEKLLSYNHPESIAAISDEKREKSSEISVAMEEKKSSKKAMVELKRKIDEKSLTLAKLQDEMKSVNEKFERIQSAPQPPASLVKDYEDATTLRKNVQETLKLMEKLKGKPPPPPTVPRRTSPRFSTTNSNGAVAQDDEEPEEIEG